MVSLSPSSSSSLSSSLFIIIRSTWRYIREQLIKDYMTSLARKMADDHRRLAELWEDTASRLLAHDNDDDITTNRNNSSRFAYQYEQEISHKNLDRVTIPKGTITITTIIIIIIIIITRNST